MSSNCAIQHSHKSQLRLLLVLLATGIAAVVVTSSTLAQPAGKVYRIGILSNIPRSNLGIKPRIGSFIKGLRDLGYIDGKISHWSTGIRRP